MAIKIYRGEIEVRTSREGDIVNLEKYLVEHLAKSGINNGVLHLFVTGSTAALTTIEYESGLREDLMNSLERIAPRDAEYKHHLRWGDDNGHSHVRASIIGPSISIPVENGRPLLGTWQQVVLVELDTRPRSRKIVTTIIGE
ncbi:MAG: secondary thiamine-phosphate synthase enzyme YjbQ [Aigarchaeota archaeon]|nr:secondary thiamine-phosphate synthase enzyme YjbQ [Aigarchaeota archaeon]MCX8192813.1 secondary thiamine-phosphate synthase enzyme YjbQ [Nitrososphaeria archaeon]MDW7986057.1 secondary thiamine-phosphate synthase enzyme YjbQ [Nitrososphaerota archaeon]